MEKQTKPYLDYQFLVYNIAGQRTISGQLDANVPQSLGFYQERRRASGIRFNVHFLSLVQFQFYYLKSNN